MKLLYKQQKTTPDIPNFGEPRISMDGSFAIKLPQPWGLTVTKIFSKRGLLVW